jgi:hypothetical protein
MDVFKNRKLLLAVGAVLALLAGIGIALTVMRFDRGAHGPSPASHGGLVVEMGQLDDTPSSNTKPLRCFVDGQFLGMATLAECAKKNGVSAQALDVGLDANGALTAADQAGLVVTPLPEQAITPPPPAPDVAGQGMCMAYDQGEWHTLAENLSPTACAQMLFSARCYPPGTPAYGRSGDQTLRAINGRVEISADNKTFHGLIEQVAPDCPEY